MQPNAESSGDCLEAVQVAALKATVDGNSMESVYESHAPDSSTSLAARARVSTTPREEWAQEAPLPPQVQSPSEANESLTWLGGAWVGDAMSEVHTSSAGEDSRQDSRRSSLFRSRTPSDVQLIEINAHSYTDEEAAWNQQLRDICEEEASSRRGRSSEAHVPAPAPTELAPSLANSGFAAARE